MSGKEPSFDTALADPKIKSCGCDLHFPNEGLSIIIEMPISTIYSTLFDATSSFYQRFIQKYTAAECHIEHWEDVLNCGERRMIKMKMPLPRLISGPAFADVCTTERILLKQPTKRLVLEAESEVKGIPGGLCKVSSRLCLSAVDPDHSYILITLDACPPNGSFFKESVRRSLVVHFSEFYAALGVAIAEHKALDTTAYGLRYKNSEEPLIRTLRNGDISGYQSYFDLAGFLRQLLWMVLLGLIFFLAIYFLPSDKLLSYSSNSFRSIPIREGLIARVEQELHSYLNREDLLSIAAGE